MINKIKKKLLVLASTFPRWRDDRRRGGG